LTIDKGLYPTVPNLYVSDASNGMVWRIDGSSKTSYQVAGASSTLCSNALDTVGDYCPANNATFSLVTGSGASLSYGVDNMFADNYSNLLLADANNNLIRELSSGTQFGIINGSKPVQTLEVHFDVGDTFSSSVTAATITTGTSNFTVGSFSAANCTSNSDSTSDCLLTLQANPTTLGLFTGTLQITSSLGKVSSFPLSGFYTNVISSTKTTVSLSAGGCSVSGNTGSGSATTLTAKVRGAINGTATGTVQFYVDGTQVGAGSLNSANTASTTYIFPASTTAHTYYATYVGDANFATSTSATGSVVSSAPSFTISPLSTQLNTVSAGATALYAFTVTPVAYTGSISFSCSGLPSGAQCIFYPNDPTLAASTISVTPCGGPYTEALSITTTQPQPVIYGFGSMGRGKWGALGMVPAVLLAFLLTLRRRKLPLKYSGVLMALVFLLAMASTVGCGKDFGGSAPGTPSGSSTVTITGVTGNGLTQTSTVTLTIK